MQNIFIFFLAIVFLSVHGEKPKDLTNPYLIPPMAKGSTRFLVFHSQKATNHSEARHQCLHLGGELADIDSPNLLAHLTTRLHDPAFILSFLGEHGDECPAIYPGTAVAIPIGGCGAVMDFVCEVPVMGTGTIHIASLGGDQFGMRERDVHVMPHGFFKQRVDDMIVTSTINILGAIATNPVLPCCPCCSD